MATATPDRAPYDRDFVTWTQEQAALLRREAARRSSTELDLENLAEEIESLGKRDWRSLTSHVARVIEHLLKLQFSNVEEPRAGWEHSVDLHRSRAAKILADSPSLGSDLSAALSECYDDGRRLAARSLRNEPEPAALPADCPYTLDQILDRDWWPASTDGRPSVHP